MKVICAVFRFTAVHATHAEATKVSFFISTYASLTRESTEILGGASDVAPTFPTRGYDCSISILNFLSLHSEVVTV